MTKKSNQAKKKVVVTTPKKTITPTKSKASKQSNPIESEMIFGKQNYYLMGAGFLIVVIGLFLMSGGSMPDANTWDDSIIYSFRRTVLAPIVIIIGLVVEIYAIFKKA